jgi:UTP:GlnB (protein PII) uridylyltransferase
LAEQATPRENTRNLRLGALALDVGELSADLTEPAKLARELARRLQLEAPTSAALVSMVETAPRLPASARRIDGLDEEPVLRLASHFASISAALDAFALARAGPQSERQEDRRERLQELVLAVLDHPETSGLDADHLAEGRRRTTTGLMPTAAARIAATPVGFVLSQEPADLARQVGLAEPPLARSTVRVAVTPIEPGVWRVDVAVPDEVGLLAHQLAVLDEHHYTVLDLATVVWPDGQSLSTFRVTGAHRPHEDGLADEIAASIPAPVAPLALSDAEVTFDNISLPWHSVCTVRSTDRRLALLAFTRALSLCAVNVVAVRSASSDGSLEVFEVTDRRGGPLDDRTQTRVRAVLTTGTLPTRRPHGFRTKTTPVSRPA